VVGGIRIGHDDEKGVERWLGKPGTKDKDAVGEFWNWSDEFNDIYIRFKDGRVSSVAYEARPAD
jgi:hypothetical protein